MFLLNLTLRKYNLLKNNFIMIYRKSIVLKLLICKNLNKVNTFIPFIYVFGRLSQKLYSKSKSQ